MALRQIQGPATSPVPLAIVKVACRIDGSLYADHPAALAELEGLLQSYVDWETARLDGPAGILGRALEAQTWELTLDAFPAAELLIPFGPVASVQAVEYVDPAGQTQTVAPSACRLDVVGARRAWILPAAAWPATLATANAVRVRFVAGTGTPGPIKQAICDLVRSRYHAGPDAGAPSIDDVAHLVAPFQLHRL